MHEPGKVPDEDVVIPLGSASIRREGSDVTLISYAKTVRHCLTAAQALEQHGISAEVVRKTCRAVVVHEAGGPCGVGVEVSAIISEKAFGALRAPVARLTGPDAPASASYPLEQAYAPSADTIVDAVRTQVAR